MGKDKYNITINRLYGSGGRIMGKKLSQELGIPFYDEEILKMASEESAVGEQYFRLNDEKAGNNLFFRAVGGLRTSLEEPSIEDDLTSPENLFRFQAKMIRRVAEEQSCIIMGRCADFVLSAAGVENLVRLFVYADSTTCIRRVMEVDGVDTKEALRRVNRISRQRRDYYKYYTGRDWEDMENYDLPINTTRLELGPAVQLVKEYMKLRNINQ
ncbi:MAG: cytidylate kinase-like family protein [Hungatella sp.]|nr:cytidylate kinase-like family protein [Hungatella sp.]MCI9635550.1 cytidylate kinase-like family protein [Hungatella sp.]